MTWRMTTLTRTKTITLTDTKILKLIEAFFPSWGKINQIENPITGQKEYIITMITKFTIVTRITN